MAKTNWQDPSSTEMRSTHISGAQEAIGKIEESIGIQTLAETGISLTEVFISNEDRCRIYQAPVGKRNWLSSPTPVIKKNGVTITDGFEIDYGGGAIIFTTRALETDVFTCDITHTVKVEGKGLSTNDFTTVEKAKLEGIETEANKTIIVNNLTETVSGKALDAVQGKALQLQAATIADELASLLYVQAEEPTNVRANTVWFAQTTEANFDVGGIQIENAQTSEAPPENGFWFEPI